MRGMGVGGGSSKPEMSRNSHAPEPCKAGCDDKEARVIVRLLSSKTTLLFLVLVHLLSTACACARVSGTRGAPAEMESD